MRSTSQRVRDIYDQMRKSNRHLNGIPVGGKKERMAHSNILKDNGWKVI